MNPTDTPSDRATALVLGSSVYLGKVVCQRAHIPPIRYTCNKACVACTLADNRTWRAAHVAEERERRTAWKRDNPEKVAAERARYAKAHPDRHADYRARDPNGAMARMRAQRSESAAVARFDRELVRECAQHLAKTARAAKRYALEDGHYAARMLTLTLSANAPPVTYLGLRARVKRGKHRALKLGRVATLRTSELRLIGETQGWRCAHCGATGDLVLDHITPLSIGGDHTAENVQFLCRFHNFDKRDMPEGDYRRLRGIASTTPWDKL